MEACDGPFDCTVLICIIKNDQIFLHSGREKSIMFSEEC